MNTSEICRVLISVTIIGVAVSGCLFISDNVHAAAAKNIEWPLNVVYHHKGPIDRDRSFTFYYDGKVVGSEIISLGQMTASSGWDKFKKTTEVFHLVSSESEREKVDLKLVPTAGRDWQNNSAPELTMRVRANFTQNGKPDDQGGATLVDYLALGNSDTRTISNGFQLSFESALRKMDYASGRYVGRYELFITPRG
ncbi:hypothetical protein [Aeromonas finlandensis]|uniref:hypothetical protein n=1 Tax=Aeromonas finlandensis TaxID=1543375 RepID=UPI0012E09AD2|nr:hypothetical protein [Aeromonas finlandensis]